MCTYQTTRLEAQGSAKGPDGWFGLTDATVYFDHPVSAPWDHTLNIDFLKLGTGSPSRVGVELDPASARELANAILEMLDAAPPALLAASQGRARSGAPAPDLVHNG
jgi:hypothetical protein